MLSAIDTANIFIDLSLHSPENDMTNLRVNKLLYFAQGSCLAKLNRPLFPEDFQAWTFGPVVPEVYRAFKSCGHNLIEKQSASYDRNALDSDEIAVITAIAEYCGSYSSNRLVAMTHASNSPWSVVFKPGEKNTVIPKELMKEYFVSHPVPEFRIDYSRMEKIGRRDADGNLILPSDEYYAGDDGLYD